MTDRWLYPWALGSVAFGGASLLVPLYVVQLGGSPIDLGLLAATAAFFGAPGSILFGRLADTVETRRPLVGVTLATVAASLAAIPVLGSVSAVIVANAALWLVVASVAPVVTTLVVEATPEPTWSERIGRLNAVQGYGWAGGLVLGTVWTPVVGRLLDAATATRALFWVLAACAFLSAAGTLRWLPVPDRRVTSRRQVRRIARLVATSSRGIRGATFVVSPHRLYWTTRAFSPARLRRRFGPSLAVYLVAAGLFLTGSAAFWAPLPLALTDAGFDDSVVFALYLLASLGSAVTYGPAGRLARRVDPERLLAGGLVVRAVSLPIVVLASGLVAVALVLGSLGIVLTVIGATWGIMAVVGTAIVTRLSPPAVRGEILGIYAALGALAGGVGGVIGGWTATAGYLVAFGVAGALVFAGAVVILVGQSLPANSPDEPIAEQPTTE